MIRALVPVAVFVVGWGLFVLGRSRAERQLSANHRGMARLLTRIEARDAVVPLLAADERRELLDLIDDFYDLPSEEPPRDDHKELGP